MDNKAYLLLRLQDLKNLMEYTIKQTPVRLDVVRNVSGEIKLTEAYLRKLEGRYDKAK